MLFYQQLFKYFHSHKLFQDVILNTQIVSRNKKHLIKVRSFNVKKKFRVYYHLRQKFYFQKLHMFFVKKKKKWKFFDLFIFKSHIFKTKVLNYSLSLKLRQLLKFKYRCNDNAFKRYITNNICNFSNRLDLVCVRSTYCPSLSLARAWICSGFITVNDFIITYWTYYLKKFDFIAIKKKYIKSINKPLRSTMRRIRKNNILRYCGTFFYKFRLRNIIVLFSKIQYIYIYFFYKFYRFNLLINLFYFNLICVYYAYICMLYSFISSITVLTILFFVFLFDIKKFKTYYLYNKRDSVISFKSKHSLNYRKYIKNLILKFNFLYLLLTVNRFKYIMFSANKCLKNACFGLFGFFKFRIIILFLFKILRYYYRSYFYYYFFFNGLMFLMVRNWRIYFVFLYFYKKTMGRLGRNMYMFMKKRIIYCLRVVFSMRKRIFYMSMSFYINHVKHYYRRRFGSYLFNKGWLLSQSLFQYNCFNLNYRNVLYYNFNNIAKMNKSLIFGVIHVRFFYSVLGFQSSLKLYNGMANPDNMIVGDRSYIGDYLFFLRNNFLDYFLIHFSDFFFHFIDLSIIDVTHFYDFNNDLNLLLFQLFIKENYVLNLFFFSENLSILLFLFNFDILFSFFFFNIFCCDILSEHSTFEYFIVNYCAFSSDIDSNDLNCKQFKFLLDLMFIDESFNNILNIFKKFMDELNLFCLFLEKKINELVLIDLLFLLFDFLKALFLKYKILFLYFNEYRCFVKNLNINFVNFDIFCYNNLQLYKNNMMILKNNYKFICNFKLLNILSLLVFFKSDFNYYFFLKKLRYNNEKVVKINNLNINYIYSLFYYFLKIFNICFFNCFYIFDFMCIFYCNVNLIFFFFNFIYIFYIFYLYYLFMQNRIDIFLIYSLFYLIFFKLDNFFIIFYYFKQFTNEISKFISNWFFNVIYFFFFNRNILMNLIYALILIKWNKRRTQKRVIPLLYRCFFSVNSRHLQFQVQSHYQFILKPYQYASQNIVGTLFVNYMWWFYVKYYVYKPLHGLSVDNLIYWKFMRLKYLNFYFSKSFIYHDIEIQRITNTFIYIGSTNSFIQNLKNNYNFFFMLILRFYKYRRSSLN